MQGGERGRRFVRSQRVSARGALASLLLSFGLIAGFSAAPPRSAQSAEAAPEALPGVAAAPHEFANATPAASPVAAAVAPLQTLSLVRENAVPAANASVAERVDLFGSIAIDTLPLHDASAVEVLTAEGVLARGQTLSNALRSRGVPASAVHVIAREVRPVYDFRRAQPGHGFRLEYDADGDVLDFRFLLNRVDSIHLRPAVDGPGWQVDREEAALETEVLRIAGRVETTLYDAIRALGENPSLAGAFAAIFAWEVDFTRSVRQGDEFQVLYERKSRVDADGERHFVRFGTVLAARYSGGTGDHRAIAFAPEGGRLGYYRPDGASVERTFLAAPLEYSRVTSTYTSARRHPILKVTRPHLGIDYAAPRGTPVWSVADGSVIYRGWGGSFGNLVKIRHANGYISYYPHLSGFSKGLRVGQSVEQKKVIGFVGSSGLATGDHVCFRIAKDGRYVNPLKVESPAAEPISEASRPAFEAQRNRVMTRLAAASVIAMER